MPNDRSTNVTADAAAQYRTPQRPGQSGSAEQKLNGPSPLSKNSTGPHPPYEPNDPEGGAASKHTGSEDQSETRKKSESGLNGQNVSITGGE